MRYKQEIDWLQSTLVQTNMDSTMASDVRLLAEKEYKSAKNLKDGIKRIRNQMQTNYRGLVWHVIADAQDLSFSATSYIHVKVKYQLLRWRHFWIFSTKCQ